VSGNSSKSYLGGKQRGSEDIPTREENSLVGLQKQALIEHDIVEGVFILNIGPATKKRTGSRERLGGKPAATFIFVCGTQMGGKDHLFEMGRTVCEGSSARIK